MRNSGIVTSQLFGIDARAGWARTLSRWYRLGRPLILDNGAFPCPRGFLPVTDPDVLAATLVAHADEIRRLAAEARTSDDPDLHPHLTTVTTTALRGRVFPGRRPLVEWSLLMTRTPFALFPFPEANIFASAIENRLQLHLADLIAPKIGMEPSLNADGTIDEVEHRMLLESIELPYAKSRRLRERAARIVERRAEKSPLSRMKTEMKTEDRKRIMLLRDGVNLIGIPNEHRADELAAALHAEFPWMGRPTKTVLHAMHRSV